MAVTTLIEGIELGDKATTATVERLVGSGLGARLDDLRMIVKDTEGVLAKDDDDNAIGICEDEEDSCADDCDVGG